MYVDETMELAPEISNYGALGRGKVRNRRQVMRLTLYQMPLADVVALSDWLLECGLKKREYSLMRDSFARAVYAGMNEQGVSSLYGGVDELISAPFLLPYGWNNYQRQDREELRKAYEQAAELAVSQGYGYQIEALVSGAQFEHVFYE